MPHRSRPVLHRPPLALHGVPLDIGAGRRGASLGPAALRLAGLAGHLIDLGHQVSDRGDVRVDGARVDDLHVDDLHVAGGTTFFVPPPADIAQRQETVLAFARRISDLACNSLAAGALPVFLGGDHSLSMGSVAGVARHCATIGRPLFVLWFDAHADFNTPDISPSGNPHGMSLALLCGEPQFSDVLSSTWHAPVDAARVSIFGARSIDRAERHRLVERGVEVVDMRLIDEAGIAAPLRHVLERVGAAGGHLHVSLDLDVMDPSLAPGVGTPVPGGLTYREAHLAMEMLHDSGLVGSLDLVELNPMLDVAGRSAELMVDLAGSLFGRRIVDRP